VRHLNHKFQIAKIKQITMTKIPNLFRSLNIEICDLFDPILRSGGACDLGFLIFSLFFDPTGRFGGRR
jgi:hypothetical protein